MATITISRDLGSRGTAVAEQLTRILDYHLVDKATLEGVLRRYGLVRFDQVYEEAPSLWQLLDWQLALTAEMLDRTIKALAHHGDMVILGRGCYAALNGLADVLNVRIQAPREVRIQRVMERQGLNQWEAEARLDKEDHRRAGFIEKAYKVRSNDAAAFDLVIDTRSITPDRAAGLIVATVGDIVARPPGDAPTATAMEVSATLSRVIRDALGCEVHHDQTPSND